VTIIPILEEVVAVEKRPVLKEALRVRRVANMREEAQTVTLRRQRAEVERLAPPTAENGQSGATPPNPGPTGS
jgi:stress response protein YsnF